MKQQQTGSEGPHNITVAQEKRSYDLLSRLRSLNTG